jgi:hypothetical protein
MKKIKSLTFTLCGVMEGEAPPAGGAIVELDKDTVLSALGILPENLKGENLTTEGLVAAIAQRYEDNAAMRIRTAVEQAHKAEMTQTAYTATEKRLMAQFGFGDDILQGVEQGKRLETIAAKIKTIQTAAVEEAKKGASADAKTLLEQVEGYKKQLAEMQTAHDTALKSREAQFAQILQKQAFDKSILEDIAKIENKIGSDAQNIQLLEGDMLRNGYGHKTETVNGKATVLITDRDGNALKSPTNQLNLLTATEYFLSFMTDFGRISKNNGTGRQREPIIITDRPNNSILQKLNQHEI